MIALAHMDPMRFLMSTDEVEVMVMQAVAQRYHEIRAEAAK